MKGGWCKRIQFGKLIPETVLKATGLDSVTKDLKKVSTLTRYCKPEEEEPGRKAATEHLVEWHEN